MQTTIAATRQRLRRALDRDLMVYEQYVASKEVLIEYLESTKQSLLRAVNDAFEDKIESLRR